MQCKDSTCFNVLRPTWPYFWLKPYPRDQWRNQALKSGWAHEVWGQKFPIWIQGRSPGGSLRGGEALISQIGYIYRQFAAIKYFSTHVCCRVRPLSPLRLPQKTIRIFCANPMTQHVLGRGHMPTRCYATAWDTPKIEYRMFIVLFFSIVRSKVLWYWQWSGNKIGLNHHFLEKNDINFLFTVTVIQICGPIRKSIVAHIKFMG